MEKQKYTYASIVPLIGGESLGLAEALGGQLPEYVLSYTPFKNNDKHYVDYIKSKGFSGTYTFLDEEPNHIAQYVDVVNSTCPCAGLSSLSTSSSGDSAVNEWMYKTAEYVLGTIGPKVFWGENAPRLYSASGSKVANRLHEIGQKYGYSLNLYYTESRLHGLSQKRGRTFYFFTKSVTAPIFDWYKVESKTIEDTLDLPYRNDDPMNILCTKEDPKDNPWAAYCMYKKGVKNIKELYDTFDSSQNLIVLSDRGLGDELHTVADWMEENGYHAGAKRARSMQLKVSDGKGYWAHGITIAKGVIPSLVAAMPYALINPHTQRYLTIRDCMRIMGMPEDFNLSHDKPILIINHICQNVPVSTARDMMNNIIKYLDGKIQYGETNFVKQNNKNHSISYPTALKQQESNTSELDEFFGLHSIKNIL